METIQVVIDLKALKIPFVKLEQFTKDLSSCCMEFLELESGGFADIF